MEALKARDTVYFEQKPAQERKVDYLATKGSVVKVEDGTIYVLSDLTKSIITFDARNGYSFNYGVAVIQRSERGSQ